jgi:hypothetical protein
MSVQVADVLDHLVARSASPSSFGAQLDRLKYGLQPTPDPFRARDEAENHLLEQATLLRCVSDFSSKEEFVVLPRQRKAAAAGYKLLERIHIASKYPQGGIALGILRAYHERSTQSQERGLVEVYNFLFAIAPTVCPPLPKQETDLLQAFRSGNAKRARTLACEAYADALLALQQFVRVWNARQ